MAQYRSMDHAALAKRGFLLGVGLFVLGILGEFVAPAVVGPLPGWGHMVLTDMEGIGILLGLFSPLVFGIILPLIE
ncbi:hypothetical protein KTS45_07595 [Halomicroarcula limicola]|uniref:Uncharacterized protein n=1 Tax=Haloarcula limicola TaxID=1429915 RepID=A0A8J7YB83_9EURY|nr:hypothetical protein [Halomicroarcula limicola]MBV0924066.1 hypothetical protein [Halomicroarcula limicola]